MNIFFAAIQRYINENAGFVVVFVFSLIAGVFFATQTITQADILNKNEHRQFSERIAKTELEIAATNARFDIFKDEMRSKMETMNLNIAKILALLETK